MTDDRTPSNPTESGDGEPTTWERWVSRLGHVYRTRVRTTTVVLVVVWFGLLAFYGFSSEHYASPQDESTPARTATTPAQTPTEPEPTSEAPSTTVDEPTSDTSEPTDTATTTEREPGPTSTTGQVAPRHNAPLETQLTTEPPTGADTTEPGGDGS